MIDYINQISSTWAEFFGLMILQNTLFLLVIFIALAALKNSSAQVKYIVGMAGIVKLLFPPFLPFHFEGLFSSPEPVALTTIDVGQFTAIPIATEAYVPTLGTLGLLFVSWIGMAVLYLLLAFGSTLVLRLKLAAAKPVHQNVQQKSELKLYQTQLISTPLSIGLFPRNVFLPSFFKSLPHQCQQVLINHELAHIKRKDGFFQLLQMFAQAVYFFHPLVWLLNERVNEYREMACDDTAIKQANLSPMEYSRYLVHMAESVVHPHWSYSSATALIRQKNKLTNRVNYLLKEATMKRSSPKTVGIVMLLLAVLIAPLSLYSSRPEEPTAVSELDTEPAESVELVGNSGKKKLTDEERKRKAKEIKESPNAIFSKGVVVDKETRVGISGGKVYIKELDRTLVADKQGNVKFDNVPEGDYNILIKENGFLYFKRELTVRKGTMWFFELEKNKSNPKEKYIYDEPPLPDGGFAAIQKKLRYPELARKAGIEGRVYVNVFVDENGEIKGTEVLKSLGENNGCDEAAVDAITSVDWTPAKNAGKPVAVWVGIPVVFKLNGEKKDENQFNVDIDEEGNIKINGESVLMQQLEEKVRAVAGKVKAGSIIVSIKHETPKKIWQKVTETIDKETNRGKDIIILSPRASQKKHVPPPPPPEKSSEQSSIGIHQIQLADNGAVVNVVSKNAPAPKLGIGAQATDKKATGKIWGNIKDKTTQKQLAGVEVILKGTKFRVKTDIQGNYYIVGVLPGEYILEASLKGYKTILVEKVVAKAKWSNKVDVILDPVVVKASTPEPIPFVAYDEPPSPIGGFEEIQRWVYYPEIARKAGVEGRVYVNVLIDENGEVKDTKILKSLGNNGLDESAIYAIKKVKWNPAKQRDRAVATWVGIPVVFKLSQEGDEKESKKDDRKAFMKENNIGGFYLVPSLDKLDQNKSDIIYSFVLSEDEIISDLNILKSSGNSGLDSKIKEFIKDLDGLGFADNWYSVKEWKLFAGVVLT